MRYSARHQMKPASPSPRPRGVRLFRRAASLAALTTALWCLAGSCGRPVAPEPAPVRIGADVPLRLIVGRSVADRPIPAYEWNQGAGRPVLILAAMHGDERPAGELGEHLLRRWLRHGEDLEGSWVVLVPLVNPDGWEADTRGNGRGVDLNRNFPAGWEPGDPADRHWGGPEPMSEPETRALAALLEGLRPARIISIHSPLHGVNFDGPAEELARSMAQLNGYPLLPDLGYPTPGSLGSYAGGSLGIPTITLELPEHGLPALVFHDNYPAVLLAVKFPLPGGSVGSREARAR